MCKENNTAGGSALWNYDHESGDVTMMGILIGQLETEKVLNILNQIPRSDMTETLKAALTYHTVDYHVCPHCGSESFHATLEMDGYESGFCVDCQESGMRSPDGVWKSRKREAGYHDFMYKTDMRYRRNVLTEE